MATVKFILFALLCMTISVTLIVGPLLGSNNKSSSGYQKLDSSKPSSSKPSSSRQSSSKPSSSKPSEPKPSAPTKADRIKQRQDWERQCQQQTKANCNKAVIKFPAGGVKCNCRLDGEHCGANKCEAL